MVTPLSDLQSWHMQFQISPQGIYLCFPLLSRPTHIAFLVNLARFNKELQLSALHKMQLKREGGRAMSQCNGISYTGECKRRNVKKSIRPSIPANYARDQLTRRPR